MRERISDFFAGLRENETLRRLTGGRPELLIYGIPAAIIVVIAAVAITAVALAGGGDGDDDAQATVDDTPTAQASPTAERTQVSAGLKPIEFSPSDQLTAEDLARRTTGEAPRGEFTGDRLIIPKIGVDAPFTYKRVPGSGQMPNPNGPSDVAYYDFVDWPGLGGLPGKGGNIVLAAHVDYINVGPAVFWSVGDLAPGDRIQIRMKDGSIVEYAVEFNKWVPESANNWEQILGATGDESITLITCTGEFSAGHYNNRQIVWGRRVTS
jgi:LPXTG-site transpeptidase (sortase) family protein